MNFNYLHAVKTLLRILLWLLHFFYKIVLYSFHKKEFDILKMYQVSAAKLRCWDLFIHTTVQNTLIWNQLCRLLRSNNKIVTNHGSFLKQFQWNTSSRSVLEEEMQHMTQSYTSQMVNLLLWRIKINHLWCSLCLHLQDMTFNYFEWITEGLLIFVFGIIGLIGNGVSVWTFWRQRIHRIFHNLLLTLAIFDMVSEWKLYQLIGVNQTRKWKGKTQFLFWPSFFLNRLGENIFIWVFLLLPSNRRLW